MKCLEEIYDEYDHDLTSAVGEAGLPVIETYMTKENLKRHLVSASITFLSTFVVTIAMAISENTISFEKGAIISLSFAAMIAGVRAVAKLILEWNSGKI